MDRRKRLIVAMCGARVRLVLASGALNLVDTPIADVKHAQVVVVFARPRGRRWVRWRRRGRRVYGWRRVRLRRGAEP